MRFKLSTLVVIAVLFLLSHASFAQVARVTAAQRTTEKSASGSDWQSAGVGANLSSSDRFRTGKRSKADLKFRDGSLVRLGQLSYLEMRGAKQMSLVRGQLLFVALRPGRVIAGAAAAAIKGSVALIQYRNYKNSEGKDTNVAEFYLYSGAMDVVTALQTISLQPGQKVTVFPNGKIVIGTAPPLQYFGGELHPDILEKPNKDPFSGSKEQTDWRDDSERIERDHDFPVLFNPDGFDNLQDDTFPQAAPPPPSQIIINPGDDDDEGGLRFAAQSASTPAASSSSSSRGIESNSFNSSAKIALPALAGLTRFADASEAQADVKNDAPSTLQIVEDAALTDTEKDGEFDLDASAAYHHLSQTNFDLGHQLGGDAALLGAGASNGAYAYGARLHGFYSNDKWFLDGAYTPLGVRARFDDDEKSSRNFSAISDLSLTYTHPKIGELQIGRQRFLSGPTQATLYGSLVRAGGREIMDAARFAPNVGDGRSLEVAYLYDAFPRNLPYRISGPQHGFYARGAVYESFGNFGINVLKYSHDDTDVSSTTGASLDFSIPVIRNKMEFYGEVGRDPFRRNLRTFGLTFPYIYEKTGWDVFLEAAHLGDAREADGPPTEYAIRGYKKLNEHMDVVAAVSRFSGVSTKFIVGFSIGARTSR